MNCRDLDIFSRGRRQTPTISIRMTPKKLAKDNNDTIFEMFTNVSLYPVVTLF